MRKTTRHLLAITSALVAASLGCVIVPDDGGYQDKRACVREFEATRFQQLYELQTDCGRQRAARLRVEPLTYRNDLQPHEGPLHGRVSTQVGENFLQAGRFTTDCAGTHRVMTLDLMIERGNASAHGAYRCTFDLDRLGRPHTCHLRLTDGTRVPDASCAATLTASPQVSIYQSEYD